MPEVKKTTDVATHATKVSKKSRMASRGKGLRTKSFEDMTNKQKDRLLKQLAVQAGLIEDTDDTP